MVPTWRSFVAEVEDSMSPAELLDHRARAKALGLCAELARARKARRLTQAALTRISGVTQCEISRIESGLTSPTTATLTRLLVALDVDLRLVPHEDHVETSDEADFAARVKAG